jgi:hypothetical protein
MQMLKKQLYSKNNKDVLSAMHFSNEQLSNIAILNELWKNREEEIKEKTWKN